MYFDFLFIFEQGSLKIRWIFKAWNFFFRILKLIDVSHNS